MSHDKRHDHDPFVAEFLSDAGDQALIEALADAERRISPAPAVRQRLMASIRGGRLHAFAEQVAQILDVAIERARSLLDDVDRGLVWQPAQLRGVEHYDVAGGPRVAAALAGFVRLAPGSQFPVHRHLGTEWGLVLQGSYRDTDGSILRAGEMRIRDAGTEHGYTALDGPPLILLAVVDEGISIGDTIIRPGDPQL